MTKQPDRAFEELMRTARASLVFLRPYLSRAILAFVLVESNITPTMAVDKYWRLYYNPGFWRWRYPNEDELLSALVATIYHEVGHRLRRHNEAAERMGVSLGYGSIAHKAMEMEINDDHADEVSKLKDIPALPEGAIYPSTYELPDHLTWEQYYDMLLSRAVEIQLPANCPTPDCGSGAHNQERPWELGAPDESGVEGIEDADARDIERLVANDIREHARGRGRVPGSWEQWSKSILRIKPVYWEHELAGGLRWTITSAMGHVYHSYQRPSRRQQAVPDVVLPSMRRPLPHIAVVGDTSGSMGAILNALPLLRGVITDVCRSLGAQVTFLSTDAEVHGGAQRIADGGSARLVGGGGTEMGVGIEAALALRPRPSAILVVTDCETLWPSKPPPVPVVIAAVVPADFQIMPTPSWAKTIRISPATGAS